MLFVASLQWQMGYCATFCICNVSFINIFSPKPVIIRASLHLTRVADFDTNIFLTCLLICYRKLFFLSKSSVVVKLVKFFFQNGLHWPNFFSKSSSSVVKWVFPWLSLLFVTFAPVASVIRFVGKNFPQWFWL